MNFISEKINQDIQEILKSRIGCNVSQKTKDSISAMILDFLEKNHCKTIDAVTVNAWESMSFWQKIRWFWCNKITNKASKAREKRIEYLKQEKDCLVIPPLPLWAENDPKSILLVDVAFQLPRPLKEIKVDFTV